MKEKLPSERPRLLVLTTTFPRWPGDVEPPFVFELCRRLSNYEVHVIAPHARGATDEEIMDGVHVHRFRYAPERLETLAYAGGIAANLKQSRWKYLLLQGFLISMLLRAALVARRHDIHLIHAHWLIPTGLIGAALKTLLPGSNRLVLTAHGGDVLGLRGKLFRILRRWVMGEADHATVVSRSLAAIGRQETWPGSDRLHIAPMGVDLRRAFIPGSTPATQDKLIFAGRLVVKKGVGHLVEAMPEVVAQLPGVTLCIAGHGPLREQLQQRVRELGLLGHVEFAGAYTTQQLPAILQQATLAVLPFQIAEEGDAEGLGLTLVEAMGVAIPVIAGDVPAVHDVVRHNVNGLLVDPADHSRLAHEIVRLLKDPSLRARLAQRGREDVLEKFDWDVTAARYCRLFDDVTGFAPAPDA